MTDIQAERLHGHIAGSLLFLCLALGGWGAFVYELSASGERERSLVAQMARLEAETGRIAAERDLWLAAHGRQQELERELAEARTELEAARAQVATLSRAQAQAQDDLGSARAEAYALGEQLTAVSDRTAKTTSTPTKRRLRRGRSR